MKDFSFALSDSLCKEYLSYKNNKPFDQNVINRILNFRINEFIMNSSQIDRVFGKEEFKDFKNKLRYARYTTQTLEELASKTRYKLILSDERSEFPYLNINNDNIEINVSGCYYKNSCRNKAISHLKSICEKATKIIIYDKYLTSCLDVLELFINKVRKLTLIYDSNHITDEDIEIIRMKLPQVMFEGRKDIPEHHDRYIIIDNNIEIILTSGFKYLSDSNKELSYIIRSTDKNRFL